MVSRFIARSGVDFDDVFEPGNSGSVPANYYRDNGSGLRYAHLSEGARAADTGFFDGNGVDLANYWAAKGSVDYFVNNGDLGNYAWEQSTCASTDWGLNQDLLNHYTLTFRSDGTLEISQTTTNHVRDYGNWNAGAAWNNWPTGNPLWYGQWLKTVGPGAGAGYEIDVSAGPLEFGRKNHYNRSNGQLYTYEAGWNLASFNRIEGAPFGMTFGRSMASDYVIGAKYRHVPTANNRQYEDAHTVLRMYMRGWLQITLRKVGSNNQRVFYLYYHLMNASQNAKRV